MPPPVSSPLTPALGGREAHRLGIGDAVLDLVHPQLSAGRVRSAEVVHPLAGLQLQEVSDKEG